MDKRDVVVSDWHVSRYGPLTRDPREPMNLRLVFDEKTGDLLDAQVIHVPPQILEVNDAAE